MVRTKLIPFAMGLMIENFPRDNALNISRAEIKITENAMITLNRNKKVK